MLTVGELFIPEGLRAAQGPLDVIVHLHGAPEVAEQNLPHAGARAVLVTVSLNGVSTVYTEQFIKAETFLNLLDEAARETATHAGAAAIPFRRVILSSFSAGFGGVRELLKSAACYQRIDGLVMADSIYAGYKNDDEDLGIDNDLMAGFLRFARDAQAGRKRMVISYCALPTEGYASTAETADYLMRELGAAQQPANEAWAEHWKCESRCEHGGLQLFGFAGTQSADHHRHLRNIGHLWKRICQ